ncbi:hypothetical protein NMYAN_120129 [Nitrosomonas nitrosa]|uniref:Uncharacterized protein n=1 Tax=Nitrosomonas nitrosa TaxID=52442 RepID=A0A8H8YZ13_9PROT|nr:hypothetical protein NMYAN_120129 [Nitrosomonas nitrosa]
MYLFVLKASECPILLTSEQEEHTQQEILPFHFTLDTPHPISGNAGGYVEINCRTESLDERDRTGLGTN